MAPTVHAALLCVVAAVVAIASAIGAAEIDVVTAWNAARLWAVVDATARIRTMARHTGSAAVVIVVAALNEGQQHEQHRSRECDGEPVLASNA